MLVGSAVRRVAIVGGVRIPFARAHGAYAKASNEEMLTAAFRGVVERFKLIEDGKILQATVTVDDPGAFKTQWSAIQRYKRGETRPMIELNCAENNYDFLGYEVVPIPEAKRPDF